MELKLLLLLVTSVYTQSIQIIPLKDDNGFALIQLEEIKIVENYNKILHIVNITEYRETIEKVQNNMNLLQLDTTDTDYKILIREISNSQRTLDSLVPKITKTMRKKRGLVNFLGSSLKFFAGTMDNEDSDEIFKHLQNLDINEKQLTDSINKQIIINKNLQTNMNQITDHINNQEVIIQKYLQEMENTTSTFLGKITRPALIMQLYTNINSIHKHLQDIKDIILLSHLEVLAHDILTEEETLKFNLTIEILPYIKTGVLFNDNLIVIILYIPNFTKEKYFKTLVLPFPNDKDEELDEPIHNVILKDNEIFNLNNKKYLLKSNLNSPNNVCIRNLLKSNNTCNYKLNSIESVTKINDEMILVVNFPKSKIIQNCINQDIIVKENFVIKYKNCEVKIREETFYNKINEYKDHITFPIINNFNITKNFKNVSLEKIHLKQIENLRTIKYVEFDLKVKSYISLGLIMLIFIISFILCLTVYFKSKQSSVKLCLKNKTNCKDTELKVLQADPFAK